MNDIGSLRALEWIGAAILDHPSMTKPGLFAGIAVSRRRTVRNMGQTLALF
jgi:hypothetical protein